MCVACETKSAVIHVWEAQGLGVAPFRCIDCFDRWDSCEACGTPIRYNFVIEDAAGKKFRVGSDCVEKTGDAGLVGYVMPLKAEMIKKAAYKARSDKRREAFLESLSAGPRGEITVMRLGKPVVFWSAHSDAEVLEKLIGMDGTFAQSLARDFEKYGRLFPRQLDWAHKLVHDLEKPKSKPEAVELGADWSAVESMFAVAAGSLKYPKVTFEVSGRTVQLSRAGERAKHPGSLNVTDGRGYGDNVWYGRIRDGKFEPSKDGLAQPEIIGFLKTFAADPAKVAGEYGKKHGCCVFCQAELTDSRSIHMGYGATCAKNFGLPYISQKEFNALPQEDKAFEEVNDAAGLPVPAPEVFNESLTAF